MNLEPVFTAQEEEAASKRAHVSMIVAALASGFAGLVLERFQKDQRTFHGIVLAENAEGKKLVVIIRDESFRGWREILPTGEITDSSTSLDEFQGYDYVNILCGFERAFIKAIGSEPALYLEVRRTLLSDHIAGEKRRRGDH